MTDRVVIPFGDRFLVLDLEAFDAALAAGSEIAPKSVQEPMRDAQSRRLLSADEIAARTGVEASWFLTRARLNDIPHARFGKYVRFDFAEVAAHLKCEGHPNPLGTKVKK